MLLKERQEDEFVLVYHLVDDGGEDLTDVGQDGESEGDPDDSVHHAERSTSERGLIGRRFSSEVYRAL